MVQEIIQGGQTVFRCPECSFTYAEREWAEKCEAWCREHHTCHLEITKRALENQTGMTRSSTNTV